MINEIAYTIYIQIPNLQLLSKVVQLETYDALKNHVYLSNLINLIKHNSEFMNEVSRLIDEKSLKNPPFELNINHSKGYILDDLSYTQV